MPRVKVVVVDGTKSYTVLFPSSRGYVEELEIDGVGSDSSNPVIKQINEGRKVVTISLLEAKVVKWWKLLPKYRSSGPYIVDGDRVVGVYFLGCYCDASNTDMAVIQEGFNKNRSVPVVACGYKYAGGCLRSDFS